MEPSCEEKVKREEIRSEKMRERKEREEKGEMSGLAGRGWKRGPLKLSFFWRGDGQTKYKKESRKRPHVARFD